MKYASKTSARSDYPGFEPVQRLVVGATVGDEPLDPGLAAELLRLKATEGPAPGCAVDEELLNDVVDEAVFVDQRPVEEGEQAHFEEAIGKLERFVEDKILVRRRERAVVAESLKGAKARREETVGSSARERVEAQILGLASRQEGLERNIGALESREDEVYRKWRDEYHQLRYRTPVVTPLFQLFFQIQAQGPGTSC